MDGGLPLPTVAGRAVDVRNDQRHAAMPERREVREVRAERRPRLAFGTTVRVEHRGYRASRGARPVHKARDVTLRARDANELGVDELLAWNVERGRQRDARFAGRRVERPDLPGLRRRETHERGTRAIGR